MSEKREWNGGRFIKSGHWKWVVPLVIVIIGVVAVGFATRGTSSNSRASGLCNDKFTQMEHRGTMATMLKEHQNMMEQMRASVSPQMLQLMDKDPMWKSMRSGEFTQMMQDQQQQIDRMLGSASTCGAP